MKEWYNSNAGLSYPDKLFLFLSSEATTKEIASLFLHEYSHTCRLSKFKKDESDYTLLDAVILEGVAEWIVRKVVGKSFGNKRIEMLPEEIYLDLWKKWIKPNRDIKRTHYKHDMIMYGGRDIPKNFGYIIGYNMVERFMKKYKKSPKALIETRNLEIITSLNLGDIEN